jgi:hypothetical protein
MVNVTEVHRVYDEAQMGGWAALKRQVSNSPLTALGVAAGVGALAYGLFKPKPKRRLGAARKVAGAIGKRVHPRQTLKAVVGTLALNYLNRKLRSKLHW